MLYIYVCVHFLFLASVRLWLQFLRAFGAAEMAFSREKIRGFFFVELYTIISSIYTIIMRKFEISGMATKGWDD